MDSEKDRGAEAVTVSIARKVTPGREADYEAWIKGISGVAATFPGHLGVNILRPARETEGKYVTIYRFASWEDCQVFQKSPERAEWLERLDDIVEGEAEFKRVTGLEFWFDLPEVPVAAQPSPHKMALTLIVVVYALVLAMNLTLGPLVADWPVWLKVALFVVGQVVLMTYVVMPRVTKLLKGWLFA